MITLTDRVHAPCVFLLGVITSATTCYKVWTGVSRWSNICRPRVTQYVFITLFTMMAYVVVYCWGQIISVWMYNEI